jgi:hypothetical protein
MALDAALPETGRASRGGNSKGCSQASTLEDKRASEEAPRRRGALKRLRPTITLPLAHLACESSLTLAKCHGVRVLVFVCLMHSHTGPLLNW